MRAPSPAGFCLVSVAMISWCAEAGYVSHAVGARAGSTPGPSEIPILTFPHILDKTRPFRSSGPKSRRQGVSRQKTFGRAGPLLHPQHGHRSACLTLYFTTVHPVRRRHGALAYDKGSLQSAFHTKVHKHHASLTGPQQNYIFMPVVTDTSGTIHSEACKLLYLLAWLKTDATRQLATTNSRARSLLGFGWN